MITGYKISIHALAKRATSIINIDMMIINISIHALAKRATRVTNCVKHVNAYFNPRPRKEGDCVKKSCGTTIWIFQSTPSQRGRPATEIADMMIAGISIHALAKRATLGIPNSDTTKRISIHALAKRATNLMLS